MGEKFVSKAVDDNGDGLGGVESCAGGKWECVWGGCR